MSFLIDSISDTTIEYELILCKPNKEPISVLDEAFDINYNAKFPTTDELSFNIPYYIMRNYKNMINPNWNLLKCDYLILLNKKNDNKIIEQKYFIIINPRDSGGEKEIKSINCYSLEYELNKKQVRSYKMPARKLYSINNEVDKYGQVGIMNYVTTLTSWNLDEITFNNIDAIFIDSKGLPLYRAFDISESTLFDFLINTVQKSFGCIFLFDTINKKISVHKIDDIGTNKGLYISESNYIKTINQELKNDEIVTRLYCYGKDNISITGVNSTGVPYIESFTYYKTTDYMSQELINALNTYEANIINHPINVEDNNPLILLNNQQYKIICNSSKANAFKEIKEVRILSNPEYIIPLNRCVFSKNNPNYIGDDKGKINISLNDSVANKPSYTYEVKKASIANADMSVVLNDTNLIITLGTDTTGLADDSKNLTMYISGAINNISGFKSVVEINGKLYKTEPENNFNLNEITIDGAGLPISYPSNTSITYTYDTFLDLRNELLILFDEKRSYQNELFTLMNGYYEIDEEEGSDILIVDGLYQIQDKIDLAIKNNSSLTELNIKLNEKEIEVCDKQLQINHVIEDDEIKDIFNKHSIYTKTNINGVYTVTHKNGILLPSSNDDLINTKQLEINNYRVSISRENNFTAEQLVELDSFVKEKTWSDSTYEDEEDLYNEGLNQLSKLSTPPLSFDLDVVDFLQIVEGKIDKTKLILGDLINIGFDKFGLDIIVRLVGYTHSIDNNSLKLNFSNKDKYDDPLVYIAELQKNAITTSTTINMDKYKWDKSEDNATRINDIIDNALDASKNAVLAGKNQDVQIGRTGISLVEKSDLGVVFPEQVKIISNKIVFTKDNWQTASTAISPQGVYAESLYGKTIVGSSGSFEGIEIYDSDDANAKKIIDIGRYIEKDENDNDIEKRGIAINSYNGIEYKNRILLNAVDGIKIQKYYNNNPVDQFYVNVDGDLCIKGDLSGSSGIFTDKIILGNSDLDYKLKFDGTNLIFSNDVKIQFKGDPGATGATGAQGPQGNPGSYYAPIWLKSTSIDFRSVSTPEIYANNATIYGTLIGGILEGTRIKQMINNILVADLFKDTYGGKLIMYDNNSLRNVAMGSESGLGDNIGGTLVLYNKAPDSNYLPYQRVEAGVLKDRDAGVINLRKVSGTIQIAINSISSYNDSHIALWNNNGDNIGVAIRGEANSYYNNSISIGKTTVASGYKLDVAGNIKCYILSTTNRGTNLPSGGSDGDLYFQYS